jgi:heptosyltransferase-2
MMQPLLMRLKAAQPAAPIDVLAPPWSEPLLARMPEVATAVGNPFAHGEFNWRGRRALARRLGDSGYAEAYVLPNSWKSALVPFLAGIPRRIGYTGEARVGLLNDRRSLDKQAMPRLVDRYAALAGPLATGTPPPRLSSDPERQAEARRALGLDPASRPYVFCPGAEYGPAKRWPARHFATLAKMIARSAEPVWLIGSTKDQAIGEEIARLAEGCAIDLCGRTTLAQAVDLIAAARGVVSNDSGLMHVAAALDRPLVALYGSSSPAYTPPLSPRAKILSRQLDCSPCFKRDCPLGHTNCLQGLMPDVVADALPRDA